MDFTPIKNYLDNIDKNLVPQCEVIVYQNNEKLFEHFVARPELLEEEKTKNLYFLYSATKVMTCTAVMRLYQEGKIDVKDPVSKYIPEFEHLNVEENGEIHPAKEVMTVEHLMSMQGGFTYNLRDSAITEYVNAHPATGTLELVKEFPKMNLKFEPGTNYQYSLCHDVLGGIIEKITGKTFYEYLDEIMFRPLGIKNMTFGITDEKRKNMHKQYYADAFFRIAKEHPLNCVYQLAENYQSGGAGMIADPQDYAKVIDVLATGSSKDGYSILSRETIDFMTKNRLGEKSIKNFAYDYRTGYGYGLGVRTLMDPNAANSKSPVGEYGWDGAAGAYVLIDPKNKLSIFYGQHVLSCRYAYTDVHPTIRNLVYDIIK